MVKFKNGTYSIRCKKRIINYLFFDDFYYVDLKVLKYTWKKTSTNFNDCQSTSFEEVQFVFNQLTDNGTVINQDEK